MSSAAGRATQRKVIAHAKETRDYTAIAMEAIAVVGSEWRAFQQMTFVGRVWWLLTGNIHIPTPNAAAPPAAVPSVDEDEE